MSDTIDGNNEENFEIDSAELANLRSEISYLLQNKSVKKRWFNLFSSIFQGNAKDTSELINSLTPIINKYDDIKAEKYASSADLVSLNQIIEYFTGRTDQESQDLAASTKAVYHKLKLTIPFSIE